MAWGENRMGKKSWLKSAEKGNLEKLKRKLAEGANIDASDCHGWTAAMLATSGGHADCLAALIEAGCDLEACSLGKENPLLLTYHGGNISCLALIIQAGANLEARDQSGSTAAMRACDWGQPECLAMLIAAGCDIDAFDDNGRSCLDIATEPRRAALIPGCSACADLLRLARAKREAIALSESASPAHARPKAAL